MKETVLDLTATEAKEFFIRNDSYCNVELPPYFNFAHCLKSAIDEIKSSDLKEISQKSPNNIGNFDNVNYKFTTNKENSLSWRQFQLINPAVYAVLCNLITDTTNWGLIQKAFKKFQSHKDKIEATSIPVVGDENGKQRSKQVTFWWENNEKRALELALEYECVAQTDISTCYDSIYTHSIPWALHGKDHAKNNRKDSSLLGNRIDWILMGMSYSETHGIPQGSIMCDFIAEILLGYLDKRLYEALDKENITKYNILRYRDDYRIFTNSGKEAEIILNKLAEILLDVGLHLNAKKTFVSKDIISASIKPGKIELLSHNTSMGLQKFLLFIYDFSLRYPNSGAVKTLLNEAYNRIGNHSIKGDEMVLISLIVNIGLKNHSTYPVVSAILSKLLDGKEKSYKEHIAERLLEKFSSGAFLGWLELWLQRVFIKDDDIAKRIASKTKLGKLVFDKKINIWTFDWYIGKQDFAKIPIVDMAIIEKIHPVIQEDEFSLYPQNY